MTFTKIASLAAGGVLLVSAGASLAQQPPAPPPAEHRGQMAPGRERPDPAAMAERRAERLRAALQLRADQEPALKTYIASMKPPARPEATQRQAKAQMSTPQRLDALRARSAERLANLDRRIAATKAFYAQLSPAQQKAFDAMAPHGGMRGQHGMRGPGGHRPMGR